ncbi:MAG TPA: YdeI/OmpD-associated family protein [Thermoanaerobaculia bacterium]|nr:YdeI/OmpD-associated family protein [Thermoanaerobaculia bacterium]
MGRLLQKETGRPSITWPESVDEALCVGWIDGLRKTIDGESYMIRFTPRKLKSRWSAVNIRRVKELIAEKRMQPAGLALFEHRDEKAAEGYSYERKNATLAPDFEKVFRENADAWSFYEKQAPYYRRVTAHWIMSAKRDETRVKRLEQLIALSAKGKRLL